MWSNQKKPGTGSGDVKDIWALNDGIYLGYGEDNKQLRYVGDRHICQIGPNGSGKTRRSILVALKELTQWSLVVVDVKGTLCKMTAAHRAAAGCQNIILNPFGVFGIPSDGFNPVAALNIGEEFPDDALEHAESMIKVEGNEPHWPQGAQDFTAACEMYARLILGEEASFGDVRAFLGQNDESIRSMVTAKIYEYKGKKYPGMLALAEMEDWEEIAIKANRFGDLTADNKELHSIISTALTQTRWLDSRPIKRDLRGPATDFTFLKERPSTVYLILPARRMRTHPAWLRLCLASIQQKLMKDTTKAKTPVCFMLDEFFAIAEGDGLPIISGNMALMREYGLKLWISLQDLPQLKSIYPERWESFIANAGVIQSFAAQDVMTCDYLSQLSGQTTLASTSAGLSHNYTPGQPRTHAQSLNLSEIQRALLLPQDIRNLKDGETYLFSHRLNGPTKAHLPYPTELPHMRDIMLLDPSR